MKDKDIKEIVDETKERINAYKKKPRKTGVKISSNMVNNRFIADIKHKRIEEGLTQKDFAKSLGMPYKKYTKYESGVKKVFSDSFVADLRRFGYNILDPDGKKMIDY